ncbi:hypothetical protein B0A48_16327 [Cryoendolithus antarcticus]|uniref:Uncharacterized protein n=1 Tax=Cryoendolithus antarcticus TaxID=1507870 RepID=A0A1V8SGP5_9PEZI|nr:hypothetical protein B0A48_16327 [Cryoendolithus antarcticus]
MADKTRLNWMRPQNNTRNIWLKQRVPAKSTSDNFAGDTFSYDDKHLAPFLMPKELNDPKLLPSKILLAANDWAQAGAALETALERIGKLRAEAVTRGWPDKASTAHLTRVHWSYRGSKDESTASHIPIEAETPPTVFDAQPPHIGPVSPGPQLAPPVLPVPTTTTQKPTVLVAPMPNMGVGMESPPFTPQLSVAPGTPANPIDAGKITTPDLVKVDSQLIMPANAGPMSPPSSALPSAPSNTPVSTAPTTGATTPATSAAASPPVLVVVPGAYSLSSHSATTATAPSTTTLPTSPITPSPTFDENAWETYLRQFHAELEDLNKNSLKRFKGFGIDQDTLAHEYSHGGYASISHPVHADHGKLEEFRVKGDEWDAKGALGTFVEWREGVRGLYKVYEEKVKAVKEPELEDVKRERMARGLAL